MFHEGKVLGRRKGREGPAGENVEAVGPEEESEPEGALEGGPEGEEAPGDPAPDFFDMNPDQAAAYRPPGIVVASKERFHPGQILWLLAFAGALGLLVAATLLLWPSTEARVPDVRGKTLTEAMDMAKRAGFKPTVSGWKYSEKYSDGIVLSQEPRGRTSAEKGSPLKLTVSKGPRPELEPPRLDMNNLPPSSQGSIPSGPLSGKTVCVDPGHQAQRGEDEWEDPGMTRRKPPEAGKRGSLLGVLEHEVTLNISLKLKSLLEKEGMNVVMTRESNDVSVSNVTRAEIGNNANADLTVHIHTAWSEDPMMEGCAVMYPARTRWTDSIYEKSKTAALYIVSELSKSTGLSDLGVFDRHDLSELNWSKVPAVEAEVGYLSSPMDENMLSEESFRWKVAWGLRDGIKKYLSNP